MTPDSSLLIPDFWFPTPVSAPYLCYWPWAYSPLHCKQTSSQFLPASR